MDKLELIRILSHAIKQILDMQEESLQQREGKIKFRQFQRDKRNDNRLCAIDITIES
jgi:hypothetical protein